MLTFYYCLSTASLKNNMRNYRGTAALCRVIHGDNKEVLHQLGILVDLFRAQQNSNSQVNSYLTKTIPDVRKFFPLQDDESLERFLCETDGLYALRKSEFVNLLKTCISDKQNMFGSSLMKTLFSLDYICGHTWPTYR